MSSHPGAKLAAEATARGRRTKLNVLSGAVALIAATSLAGCMPDGRSVTVAGDPANPSAGHADVGYRSTLAPYTSMRPSTPVPWRERNDGVTPPAQSGQ
jgi:hypothetical protein